MKKIIFAALLITVIAFAGCKKSQSLQESQTAKGNVSLVDATNSFLIVNNITGTTVTVENSGNTTSLPVNSDGDFIIPRISATGITTLVYSHAGYGTFKQYFSPAGLDSLRLGLLGAGAMLHPVSDVLVNTLSGVIENNTLKLTCNVSFPNETGQKYIALFHQKNNPAVLLNNSAATSYVFAPYPVNKGDNSINICLCTDECKYLLPGDTLYIKAFGAADIKFGDISYLDPLTNSIVFPSVNQNSNSPTLSFIIP